MNNEELSKLTMQRNNFIINYFNQHTFQQLYFNSEDIKYYINVYTTLKNILDKYDSKFNIKNENLDLSLRYLLMNERNRLNDGIKIPFKNSSEYIKEIHEKRTEEKKEVLLHFDKLFLN